MKRKLHIIGVLFFLMIGTGYALTYKVLTTVVSVGVTATALPATAMVGREYIQLQNVGTATIFVGDANVTADTAATGGTQILPYAYWIKDYDHTIVVYGIVAAGTQNGVVEEGK